MSLQRMTWKLVRVAEEKVDRESTRRKEHKGKGKVKEDSMVCTKVGAHSLV